MVEIKTEEVFELNIAGELEGELGIVVHKGHVMACGQSISEGNMLVSKSDDACSLQVGEHTHLFIFGGKPLPEERFIAWNFVSHSKEKLAEAKELWRTKKFPEVPCDTSYIAFPESIDTKT
jgi:redox-sensitive bicupin YhaK (pirin superfamily)